MTTFKSTMRSYSAAIHRMERAQQKRTREAVKQYKIQQKQQEIANAATAVKEYEHYIDVLKSVHKDAMDPIDWESMRKEAPPYEPVHSSRNEELAIHNLNNYRPSLLDKWLNWQPKRISRLEKNVTLAREKDGQLYEQQKKAYEKELAGWQESQQLSRGILSKDPHSYQQAIEYFEPFSEIRELGSKLNFQFNPNYIIADLHVNNDEVIPREILSQTSTGKLSKKDMPVSRYNELYQDFVCSCVLRVARELLACIPVELTTVNAVSELLNTSTGRMEQQTILSVVFFPNTLNKLNFIAIDPSDAMKNFSHNMKFSKTNGFSPVEKIDPAHLLSSR